MGELFGERKLGVAWNKAQKIEIFVDPIIVGDRRVMWIKKIHTPL